MASRDQERRNEYAAEHGYDSYNEMRNAISARRESAEGRGVELDAYQARDQLDFMQEVDVENSSRDELKAIFEDHFGYYDDGDFYDWLHGYYEQTAG